MADIYQFPPAGAIVGVDATDEPLGTGPEAQEPRARVADPDARTPDAQASSVQAPDDVLRAVDSVRRMARVDGVDYREIPVPSRLADWGIGVGLAAGGVPDTDGSRATGWIMALHRDPAPEAWRSRWRCAAFASAPLPGGAHDALAADMIWDSVVQSLAGVDAEDAGGTVTITHNAGYGTLGRDGGDGPAGAIDGAQSYGFEVRVSWTPATMDGRDPDVGAHVAAWARFVRDAASPPDGPDL